jgi:hypothetical protein
MTKIKEEKMTKIKEEARKLCLIIHSPEVRKVLYQIKFFADNERPDELSEVTQEEYDNLVSLLSKYFSMLKKL